MSKRKGRIITSADAKNEIDTFISINALAFPKITSALAGESNEVKKYYSENVTSFVFAKSLIEALLKLSHETESDAIRVYLAAAYKEEENVKKGTPSIILVPAKLDYHPNGEIRGVANKPYSEEIFGIQYPGIVTDPHVPAPFAMPFDPKETQYVR